MSEVIMPVPDLDAGSIMGSRRLPVYFLLDTSGSMTGDPIVAVNEGVSLFAAAAKSDPHGLETIYVGIITFGNNGVIQEMPLTDITMFQPQSFSAGGGTPLGEAFTKLGEVLKVEVRQNASNDSKGDYKPLVFLLTDGFPTDNYKERIAAFKARKHVRNINIIAIGCGSNADTSVLKEITEMVFLMQDMTIENMRKLFQWITQTALIASKTASQGSTNNSGPDVNVPLPKPPPGVQFITL